MKTNHIIKNVEMFITYLYQSILQILVILVYPYINKGLYELSLSHSARANLNSNRADTMYKLYQPQSRTASTGPTISYAGSVSAYFVGAARLVTVPGLL